VVLLIGMGVLAHDAVHRVLFRSVFWNDLWGGMLSALALIPFYSNRQFHLTHHSYAHQPGLDPEDVMHDRPFLVAATVGSLLALNEQYRILFTSVLRLHDPRYTGRVLKDLAFMGGAGTIYFVLLPAAGIALAYTVWPVIALFPLVFAFRAMSDHYGIPPIERAARKREEVLETDAEAWVAERERRQREVSGWVVLTAPWLEWLWSNVNYHEVHHKYPYLSYRYLPQVFAATRTQFPYLVVQGYWRSLWNLRKRPYYGT
jgi:fatty acid desaturase